MDGSTFVYDGRSGPWACRIYLLTQAAGNFAAVGDVALDGRHRCKLVLCQPRVPVETGLDLLKRRCVDWIEQVERHEQDSSRTQPIPA